MRKALDIAVALVWVGGIALVADRVIKMERLRMSIQDTLMDNEKLGRQIRSLEDLRDRRMSRATGLRLEQMRRIRQNARFNAQNLELESQAVQLEARTYPLLGDRIYGIVDTQHNRLYLRKGQRLLLAARCSVGKGGKLTDAVSGRKWEFTTPKGVLTVLSREKNPVWWKPDWAFIEESKPVPPPGAPERKAEGELGRYALNLGYGYKIHGTRFEYLLGRPVTHGCVRLGSEDLEQVFQRMGVGAKVYVY